MTDYPKPAPIIKKAYKAWEDKVAREQKEVEAGYPKIAKTDKPAVDKILDDFNLRVMADAGKLTEDPANQLFTIHIKDIQSDILFTNATKKD